MIVREYAGADLPAMIAIWNEVVEDGIAFHQEEQLALETGTSFLAEQTYCGVAGVDERMIRDLRDNRTPGAILLNMLIAAVSLFVNGFGVYLTIQANIGGGAVGRAEYWAFPKPGHTVRNRLNRRFPIHTVD